MFIWPHLQIQKQVGLWVALSIWHWEDVFPLQSIQHLQLLVIHRTATILPLQRLLKQLNTLLEHQQDDLLALQMPMLLHFYSYTSLTCSYLRPRLLK